MAVVVKVGGTDPGKRPEPNSKAAAAGQSGSRPSSGESGKWFQDRRIQAVIVGAVVLMAVLGGLMFFQTPKPTAFPVTRATVDEVDPVQAAPATQSAQPPAYDPN